jgi:hypothetical protein
VSQPLRQNAAKYGVILGNFSRPFRNSHTLVAGAIQLCAQRSPLHQCSGPVARVPCWLRTEQYARPRSIITVSVVEPRSSAEIADALAVRVSVGNKFRSDRFKSARIADRCSARYANASMSHKPHDAISGAREPELYPRVQDLVGSRIPSESKNEIARPFMNSDRSRRLVLRTEKRIRQL